MGAVKRDFEESFRLGVDGGVAEDAGVEDRLDFIRREDEVRRCLDGEEVGALLPEGGGLSCGGLAGRLLESRAHDCAHGAVMFSVASAAGREVRLRWGRGEERRGDRKDEEQQQRDGEKAAHASWMKLDAMGKSAERVRGYNAAPKPWYGTAGSTTGRGRTD
jgi:hypothetical protein